MHLRRGLDRTGDNSLQRTSNLMGQSLDHRVTGFPQGDDQNARIRMQVVKIVADAQQSTLAMHMPRETSGYRRFSQSV